jgi:hypothetical protein
MILTSTRQELSPESTTELDLLVRTLVSDLRDVQLTMGCVPPPESANSAPGTAGPAGELRVGPLQFPGFAVGSSSSPGPPGHAPALGPPPRSSMGAWDFSMPARASPGEPGRAGPAGGLGSVGGSGASSNTGAGRGRAAGEMDPADLVRQLQPAEVAGSEEEDLYEEDEDEEHAAAARARPKT